MAPFKRDTVFAEVTGKTVRSIKYEENSEWQALEVVFSDGTLFSFEFGARATVKASYLEVRQGDLEMIRNYGLISSSPRKMA